MARPVGSEESAAADVLRGANQTRSESSAQSGQAPFSLTDTKYIYTHIYIYVHIQDVCRQ